MYKKTVMTLLKLVKEGHLGIPRIDSSSDFVLTRLGPSADLDPGVLVAVKEGEGNAIKYLASDTFETWLLKNKLPYVAELTTGNFISIMKNPTQPFVILAALSAQDDTLQGNIAAQRRTGSRRKGPISGLEALFF